MFESAVDPSTLSTLPVSGIARMIRRDWGAKVSYAAAPYLSAMMSLDSVSDAFGMDDGRSIILYFLANASTYRGANAKILKAELKRRLAS